MRVDLTSPFDPALKASVVISDLTGEAVLDSGEGGDLEVLLTAMNDSRHGGVEAWVPPLEAIVDWATARGIHYAEHDVPDRAPVDPDVVY